MRLGREVDHRVMRGRQPVDPRAVGDVADLQGHPVRRCALEGLPGRGVGQLVEDGHRGRGVRHQVMDEVGADEAGAAGDENAIHGGRV